MLISFMVQFMNPTSVGFFLFLNIYKKVSVENSIRYYLALKKHSVSTEMHIYEKGGHGFGLGIKNTSQFWVNDCTHWLKFNGLID